jgi:cytochrome P450/NADPH-cytochrome P450 reductase
MSDEQICDEMRTFLLAGHDTTSGTLQWAYYHMSHNPEAEFKLYQEAKQVLSKGDPEYDVRVAYFPNMFFLGVS